MSSESFFGYWFSRGLLKKIIQSSSISHEGTLSILLFFFVSFSIVLVVMDFSFSVMYESITKDFPKDSTWKTGQDQEKIGP